MVTQVSTRVGLTDQMHWVCILKLHLQFVYLCPAEHDEDWVLFHLEMNHDEDDG